MRRCEGRRGAIGAALLLLGVAASTASANTRSQQLFARALVPFHAQRWDAARQLLDQAAAVDPNDAVVLYYRGLTSARLGLPDKAIADIEHALSLRPDLQPAVLDLGILYFQTGQYQPALDWLQRAYKQPMTRFSAAFFLGVTKLRMGDPQGAEPFLAEASKDPSMRQSADYYSAVAMLRSGDAAGGRALLQRVQTGAPDLETTQIATQYLQTAPTVAAGATGRPWSVYAGGGFGYDSNAALAPDNITLAPGKTIQNCYTQVNGQCVPLNLKGEEDGFFAIALGGAYRLFAVDQGQGTLGYDFYQSVHFSTSRFDLQNQELHLDLSTGLMRSFQLGVSGFYDFYMLNWQSFYNQGRAVPWVTYFEGNIAATQGYYQFISQDYSRGPFSPFRDAFNNAVGLRQYFLLGAADRYMSIGYQWDDNDPLSRNGTDFAYNDNIIDARVDFGILDWARGTIGYAIDLQDYKHPNSRTDFAIARHDVDNQLVFRFVHDFTPYISANLAYYGVFNISNIPDFQYNRSIVQAEVQVHF